MKSEAINPWQNRWQNGQTGWDLGREHPLIRKLMTYICDNKLLDQQSKPSAYVPGCGRGHEAAYLAKEGLQVVAADFVPEAIKAANQTHGHIDDLEFRVEDALTSADEKGRYDLICDRAMLCALNPDMRNRYIQSMKERLKDGGLFIGVLFAQLHNTEKNGPPFALDQQQLFDLFSRDFSLVYLVSEKIQTLPIVDSEWLTIWKKKSCTAY